MAANDLTTLSNFLLWQPQTGTALNPLIQQLITRISGSILDYLQRGPLYSRSYTDTSDGQGTYIEYLDKWPVTSVASVTLDGYPIPFAPISGNYTAASTPWLPASGYRFAMWDGTLPGSQQQVELLGGRFTRGIQNLSVTYTAGYLVQSEAQTIPAGTFEVTPAQPFGTWCYDNGVTYAATGLPLTPIPSGTPNVGQYVPPNMQGADPVPYYQFAAADAGAGVLLNYSFIPPAIEEACIDWVSERLKYRNRIGLKSEALGGKETFAYDLSAIPAYIKSMLNPYRKTLPV